MTFIFLNNKLYIKVNPQELKEVPLYILAGRSIKDIYKDSNSVIIEVL